MKVVVTEVVRNIPSTQEFGIQIGERVRSMREWFASLYGARSREILILAGVLILTFGLATLAKAQGGGPTGSYSQAQFDDSLIRSSVGMLFKLIEGGFGALIMVVSGLGAIVAASMGAYRAAVGMLVVAVGSFILRSLVSLFFGTDFQDYEA